MDDNESILELLDTLMDAIEKQDEIIYRMSQLIKRMATDLAMLRNDENFSKDMEIVNETMQDYEKSKKNLEDHIRI